MNYFDNEMKILEWFRDVPTQCVCFPHQSEDCVNLYTSLTNSENFKEWINSSGKSDPPPDFYNPKLKIMMDVMRVDDHGHVNENGKFINPVNQRESEIQRQIRTSGFLDNFPNLQEIIVNAVTDLPSYEDHNHNYYFENFSRTIKKHIERIPLYQRNHPEYVTTFFVFDESSGYVLVDDEKQAERGVKKGEQFYYRPYLHFSDKRFADIFLNSNIDFLIWYSPFKHFETTMPEMPTACVYDIKKLTSSDFIDYPAKLIMSVDE